MGGPCLKVPVAPVAFVVRCGPAPLRCRVAVTGGRGGTTFGLDAYLRRSGDGVGRAREVPLVRARQFTFGDDGERRAVRNDFHSDGGVEVDLSGDSGHLVFNGGEAFFNVDARRGFIHAADLGFHPLEQLHDDVELLHLFTHTYEKLFLRKVSEWYVAEFGVGAGGGCCCGCGCGCACCWVRLSTWVLS